MPQYVYSTIEADHDRWMDVRIISIKSTIDIFGKKKRGKTGEKFVGPLTTENTL